jgi:hypothetical protein
VHNSGQQNNKLATANPEGVPPLFGIEWVLMTLRLHAWSNKKQHVFDWRVKTRSTLREAWKGLNQLIAASFCVAFA